MRIKTLKEPLLEFGTGAHICPRTGIERMGVYDSKDPNRRTELRIGIVGRGEGVDSLDVWLEACRREFRAKTLNIRTCLKDSGELTNYTVLAPKS